MQQRQATMTDFNFYIPLLWIWGVQWMADAALQIAWAFDPDGAVRTLLLWTAAALSALYTAAAWIKNRQAKRRKAAELLPLEEEHPTMRSKASPFSWMPLLVAAVLIAAAVLLVRFGAVGWLFTDVFRSLVLALFYIGLGLRIGRELVFLGLWLLALCAFISVWYLGFAPIVLGLFGGASLIACAIMVRLLGPKH